MSLDTFLIVASFALCVLCQVGLHHCRHNVRVTYKDQRIPEVRK